MWHDRLHLPLASCCNTGSQQQIPWHRFTLLGISRHMCRRCVRACAPTAARPLCNPEHGTHPFVLQHLGHRAS